MKTVKKNEFYKRIAISPKRSENEPENFNSFTLEIVQLKKNNNNNNNRTSGDH